jgi:hypothetical protein
MRILVGRQKDRAIDLPSLEKTPAVATAAFCDPRPTCTPASATALHGAFDAASAGSGNGKMPGCVGTGLGGPGSTLGVATLNSGEVSASA